VKIHSIRVNTNVHQVTKSAKFSSFSTKLAPVELDQYAKETFRALSAGNPGMTR
jgi:hypothetical protein